MTKIKKNVKNVFLHLWRKQTRYLRWWRQEIYHPLFQMNHEFLVSGECHIFSQSEAKTTLHFSDSNAHFMIILSVVDFLIPLQYSSVKFAQNSVLSESETDMHRSRQWYHHSRSLVYHSAYYNFFYVRSMTSSDFIVKLFVICICCPSTNDLQLSVNHHRNG